MYAVKLTFCRRVLYSSTQFQKVHRSIMLYELVHFIKETVDFFLTFYLLKGIVLIQDIFNY